MHLTDEQIMDQALGDVDEEAMAHIAVCAHCSAEFEAYRNTLKTVRDNLPSPPEGYADRLWAALEPRLTPRRPPRPLTPLLAAAATLVVACIAGLFAWRYTQTPPAGPPKLEANNHQHRQPDVPPTAEEELIIAGTDPDQLAAIARISYPPTVRIPAINDPGLSAS